MDSSHVKLSGRHGWDVFLRSSSTKTDVKKSGAPADWGHGKGRKSDEEQAWWGSSTEPRAEAAAKFDEGLALIRDGQKAEALAAWERAVELNPENRRYQSNLRLLRKATGRDDED